jgi:hypothetical protein
MVITNPLKKFVVKQEVLGLVESGFLVISFDRVPARLWRHGDRGRQRGGRTRERFSDGRQITLGDLPAGLIFDVPGSEQLSTLLDMEPAVQHEEEERVVSMGLRNI